MKLVRASFSQPAEHIAFDELLLKKAVHEGLGESVWFWESDVFFVALGRISKISRELLPGVCSRDGIEIIRRLSGGASVLQGPGCLNYTFVLDRKRCSDLNDVGRSYKFILSRIAGCLKGNGLKVSLRGLSDLVFHGKKVSGNAQIRKRGFILHHGTLLFDMDRKILSRYLDHPPVEPDYREGRAHSDFVGNIPAAADTLKRSLLKVFEPDEKDWEPNKQDIDLLHSMVNERYSSEEWTYKF